VDSSYASLVKGQEQNKQDELRTPPSRYW